MKQWLAAGIAAVVAAYFVLVTEIGRHIWNALVAAGALTPPPCSDGVTLDGVGVVTPMCVQPASLIATVAVVAVATAASAGAVAFATAGKLCRR